jgi:flagellar basal-body rod protein FlgC
MSSFKIFEIAGSGMSAQSVRLNTTASNLANADSVSGNPSQVYKSKHPLFEAIRASLGSNSGCFDL